MDPKNTFRWRGLLARTIREKKLTQKTGESIFLYFKYLSGIEEKENWAEFATKIIQTADSEEEILI